MWEPKRKGGVKLYAKRVFIMEGNEELASSIPYDLLRV